MRNQGTSGDDAASLAEAIGARVRLSRQNRGWTLDQLAQAAGVSRRMIVNVEHGEANPSVGTLLKISDALGVGLPALVEMPNPEPVTVTPRGEGAVLWHGEAGGRGVLVAGTEPPDVVELWDWTLAPGDRHESEAHTAGTRELVLVLEGSVALRIGDREILLDTGDAASFASDVSHTYSNEGAAMARFALTVFEPGVGVDARLDTKRA